MSRLIKAHPAATWQAVFRTGEMTTRNIPLPTVMDNNRPMLRDLFPVTSNIVYMNCAAVGPLSVPAAEAMIAHAVDQREYGALHWREWYAEYVRLREAAARLLGATPAEIASLKNTSAGLSFVAEGIRWRAGDNVVTSDLEFPSNSTPWRNLDRRGVALRVVRSRGGAFAHDDVEALIDDRTRVVTISSVAFHNGFSAE